MSSRWAQVVRGIFQGLCPATINSTNNNINIDLLFNLLFILFATKCCRHHHHHQNVMDKVRTNLLDSRQVCDSIVFQKFLADHNRGTFETRRVIKHNKRHQSIFNRKLLHFFISLHIYLNSSPQVVKKGDIGDIMMVFH